MDTTLHQLHHQDADWQRALDFYSEEINLLLPRLKAAQEQHATPEVASQFEDFSNQLHSLQRNISEMKHNIAVRDKVVENMTEERLGGDDAITTPEDVIQREMNDLVEEIANTRFFLNLFLSRL
ncbi:MAG: hypothetical protein IPH78_11085 [Bacteroidetes bacterium]|nr:hypothetical protein [Bacteroidota bacterium]